MVTRAQSNAVSDAGANGAALPCLEGLALREAFCAMRRCLLQAGVEDAAFDASQLVRHVTGLDRRLQPDAVVTPPQAVVLAALTRRRCGREPLQYLLGSWDFLDFTLRVGPGVLIPRADTELVCQTAIAAAQATFAAAATDTQQCADGTPVVRVLDLCAGSGAIAIGVARALPTAHVTAVELSDDALVYLQQNTQTLAPHTEVVKADVFNWQDTLPDACVQVIVSNPPYITPQEMETLAPELDFEPRMALAAAENGLVFYRHIARAYRRVLRPGGVLVFEIGSAQSAPVSEILRQSGYAQITVLSDAAGLPRCVRAIAL